MDIRLSGSCDVTKVAAKHDAKAGLTTLHVTIARALDHRGLVDMLDEWWADTVMAPGVAEVRPRGSASMHDVVIGEQHFDCQPVLHPIESVADDTDDTAGLAIIKIELPIVVRSYKTAGQLVMLLGQSVDVEIAPKNLSLFDGARAAEQPQPAA